MKRLDAIVYDAEIVNCVPTSDEPRDPDLAYCQGWNDKAGMGVAVVAAIDLWTGQPRIFLEDNLAEFAAMVATRFHLIGFNSKSFDDPLLAAAGVSVTTTYDLKLEFFKALGQRLKSYKGGRTLDAIAAANLGEQKSMKGALAPVLWQRGQKGQVIDYCLKDVFLTARLIHKLPALIDPVTGQTVTLTPMAEAAEVGSLV